MEKSAQKPKLQSKTTKMVVGLGNPTSKYEKTRHNFGRRVVEALKTELPSTLKIFQPTTFMNECGPEIKRQLDFYKVRPSNLLIIHDELDLPFGEIRLQYDISAAGHHGVESIMSALGTSTFWRLRLGIGPRGSVPGEQFVLERFSEVEERSISKVTEEAINKVKDWLTM